MQQGRLPRFSSVVPACRGCEVTNHAFLGPNHSHHRLAVRHRPQIAAALPPKTTDVPSAAQRSEKAPSRSASDTESDAEDGQRQVAAAMCLSEAGGDDALSDWTVCTAAFAAFGLIVRHSSKVLLHHAPRTCKTQNSTFAMCKRQFSAVSGGGCCVRPQSTYVGATRHRSAAVGLWRARGSKPCKLPVEHADHDCSGGLCAGMLCALASYGPPA